MYREPIVMGRKLELKSTVWTRKKKEHPEQNEETRIQKNEERLRNLHLETFQHPNYRAARRRRGRTKN